MSNQFSARRESIDAQVDCAEDTRCAGAREPESLERHVSESGKTILLVVDDESTVCRVVRRLMRDKFDEIATAETPADAEIVLSSRAVTHVICDHVLGPGQPHGLELAGRWKATYPSIRTVVVLTGANVSNLETPPGVDLVLPKTTEPAELAAHLGV
jgi:CheY-like chemotaxis protein